MTLTTRINMWSGPRNVSTAFMYSFAQRPDTRVVDEPLYAAYLDRFPDVDHPGRDEVLASQDRDAAAVVRDVVLGPCDRPILFLKQMAHHLQGITDRAFLGETANVLLIRDPAHVLLSYTKVVGFQPRVSDTGIDLQCELLDDLRARGQEPAVVDSRLLLQDPPGVLRKLCEHLGMAFDEAMLSWDAGARPEDGVWASYWYSSVHRSTGFAPYKPPREELPASLVPVADACRPFYEKLYSVALRTAKTGD